MRLSLAICFAGFALFLSGCQASQARDTASDPKDAEPIATASATMYVKGMSCPQCSNNIDKQLMRVSGVKAVTIDLGTGKVVTQFAESPRPSKQQLAQAVENSGFTLERIETP